MGKNLKKMDVRETVEKLSSILQLLPGVAVESTDERAGNISLELTIKEVESIGPISYAAQGANVGMDMWTTASRMAIREWSNPALMRYMVRARGSEEKPGDALERLQFFGVYLVWYLHETGALATVEANQLLDRWNGMRVDS